MEPGQIVITAERLTEVLDAGDLRQRLDSLTIEAIAEGDAWAARNQERAEKFLQALLADQD